MEASKIRRFRIVRINVSTGEVEKKTDLVAEEKPLHIFLNKTFYATVFCTPSNLKELAVGHVLSEGLVKSVDEIEKISLKEEACQITLKSKVNLNKRLKLLKPFSRVILSACGSSSPYQFTGRLPKVKSELKVKAETISSCVNNLNFVAQTFRKTGGVHAAAIHKGDGKLVTFAEDIGRHNAVDKVVGYGALNKIDFGACFLVLSGRLTGDIVVKAARAGLPIVASLAAAVDSGIKIAKNTGLTLIGFVRGRRMNIYSCEERVAL